MDQRVLWESRSHFLWVGGEVGAWEERGKVCIDLSFFPFLFSSYLYDSVGVDSVSGPHSFSLVFFPPPTLGSPPVCLQSAVCCKGEAGDSPGSDTVAVGSYCS